MSLTIVKIKKCDYNYVIKWNICQNLCKYLKIAEKFLILGPTQNAG